MTAKTASPPKMEGSTTLMGSSSGWGRCTSLGSAAVIWPFTANVAGGSNVSPSVNAADNA